MPMTEALEALVDTNKELIEKVRALDAHLTIAEEAGIEIAAAAGDAKKAVDRSRVLTKVSIVFSILALISAGLAFWSIETACSNANETRAGNLAIWQVVLAANQKTRTAEQARQSRIFDAYVRRVYRPHDCSRPFKAYPLPPAPTL